MNRPSYLLSFSCERASDHIPPWAECFFSEQDLWWQEAERFDPYALELAQHWAILAKAPLFLGTLSYQVCNLDRSHKNPAIWSPWTHHVPTNAKKKLLAEWYMPYRKQVLEVLAQKLLKGHRVLHLSIRSSPTEESFPFFNLQYSTSHPEEKHVACAWQSVLRRTKPNLSLRRNNAKHSHADSHSNALREHFSRIDFLSIGVNCSRDGKAKERAETLHNALKKVLHGMWR